MGQEGVWEGVVGGMEGVWAEGEGREHGRRGRGYGKGGYGGRRRRGLWKEGHIGYGRGMGRMRTD